MSQKNIEKEADNIVDLLIEGLKKGARKHEEKMKRNNANKNMSYNNTFCVKVEGPSHLGLLKDIAHKESPYNFEEINYHSDLEYITFNTQTRYVYDTPVPYSERVLENPNLREFREALRGEYNWEEPITIFGAEVEFDYENEEIVVSGDRFSFESIKSLYSTFSELDDGFHSIVYGQVEVPFSKVDKIYRRIKSRGY